MIFSTPKIIPAIPLPWLETRQSGLPFAYRLFSVLFCPKWQQTFQIIFKQKIDIFKANVADCEVAVV